MVLLIWQGGTETPRGPIITTTWMTRRGFIKLTKQSGALSSAVKLANDTAV
jgi:hypothetical protein